MGINHLLNNRHTIRLSWCEPRPGLTIDNNKVDCHITSCATVHDCINLMRRNIKERHCTNRYISDKTALVDFMGIYWAKVIK